MKFSVLIALFLASVSAGRIQDGRIYKGTPAKEQQFPFIVAVDLDNHQGTAWCGGSLISPEWVLTAAHCTGGAKGGYIRLGMVEKGKSLKTARITANDIIVHENYNRQRLENDIALIHIKPVELSSSISTIKLADGSVDYTNTRAVVAGWGHTTDANRDLSNHLLFANLIVEPNSVCKARTGLTLDSNICASSTTAAPCEGDSGGPMVSNLDGKQIGLVSFGTSYYCEDFSPNVYTRISSYIGWIKSKTGLTFN